MLQDVEAGRRLEVAALTTVVRELGELTGIATPTLDGIDQLVRLLDATVASEDQGPPTPF